MMRTNEKKTCRKCGTPRLCRAELHILEFVRTKKERCVWLCGQCKAEPGDRLRWGNLSYNNLIPATVVEKTDLQFLIVEIQKFPALVWGIENGVIWILGGKDKKSEDPNDGLCFEIGTGETVSPDDADPMTNNLRVGCGDSDLSICIDAVNRYASRCGLSEK